MTESPILEQISTQIKTTPVVLYMKGTASAPQCGFSSLVVKVLKALRVSFKEVNVLEHPEIRQGIKDYSHWPTIPQLYIQGEFIGGSDIVREMYEAGELQQLLKDKGIFCEFMETK